jgi:hypothetical protein
LADQEVALLECGHPKREIAMTDHQPCSRQRRALLAGFAALAAGNTMGLRQLSIAGASLVQTHSPATRRCSMKWITRERVKVDRVACPWLIKKFVDKDAEFIFVPPDKVMQEAKRDLRKDLQSNLKDMGFALPTSTWRPHSRKAQRPTRSGGCAPRLRDVQRISWNTARPR